MIWLQIKLSIDKTFNIAKNHEYDRYQRGLALMFYNFFDKKSSGGGVAMLANKSPANDKIKQNQCPLHLAMQQLAKELHKPIIRKLKKKKVDSSFKVNI